MDAIKFIDELNRMCKSHDDVCTDCPLMASNCPVNDFDVEAEKVVPIVEEWSKKHPVMTNGRKLSDMLGINKRNFTRRNEGKPYVEIWIDAEWWDAESPEHDGCKNCKHSRKNEWEEPCIKCKQNFKDKWEKWEKRDD